MTQPDLTAPFAAGTPTDTDWIKASGFCRPDDWSDGRLHQYLDYGAYLDAADLLRPEGWDFGHVSFTVGSQYMCGLSHRGGAIVEALAPTEACARAIAAIRAREAG